MKIASICRKIRGETVGRVYPCRCHFSISKSSASDSFGWPVSERFEIDSCKQKKCDTFISLNSRLVQRRKKANF